MQCWQRLLFNWSAEKAWFTGVLLGDGNVYINECTGDYRVSVCGSISTVTRWLKLVDDERHPKEFSRSPGTFQGYINNKELVSWLKLNMGLAGPKSDVLVWPVDLPLEFERDFIRGLYDTDGSLFISNRRHLINKGADYPVTKYDSNTESFVFRLRTRLEYLLDVNHVAVSPPHREIPTCYSIKYTGLCAMRVADYLYGSTPVHLVNQDRVDSYNELCRLRNLRASTRCTCGFSAVRQGLCSKCWWVDYGTKTGVGTVCSTDGCRKPITAKGKCIACYNRERRADPKYTRKSTGICLCGSVAYRKGMCDRCYSAARRKQ